VALDASDLEAVLEATDLDTTRTPAGTACLRHAWPSPSACCRSSTEPIARQRDTACSADGIGLENPTLRQRGRMKTQSSTAFQEIRYAAW
jgi:hypothetical protein